MNILHEFDFQVYVSYFFCGFTLTLLIYFIYLVLVNRSERKKYNYPITEAQFNLAMNQMPPINKVLVQKKVVVRKKWSKEELMIISYLVIHKDIDSNMLIGLQQLLGRSESSIKTKIWRLDRIAENYAKGRVSTLDWTIYYETRALGKNIGLAKVCKAVEDTGRGEGFINTYVI